MKTRIRKKIAKMLSVSAITIGICTFNINNTYAQYNKIIYKYKNFNEVTFISENAQRKIAYITIDDGPSKYTESIVDTLKKYGAKATFFMIDRNMKTYPEQVKNIVKNGNTAGFHSVSHDIHQLYKYNTSAKEEFDKNKETFYNITNTESNIIRLPYGSKPYTPVESYELLVDSGYKLWDWDLDTEDWKSSSSQILESVKKYSENKKEVVILIHEKKQTVEALDGILKYLTEQGYEILPIDQEQQPQNFWLGNLYK
ncbi:MAG: polysaccharide deacetylase family protein [Romboutsia sp.]|uniref:polysaccharide deacetylase family protein n=1 Tax=Romboutsia sp. TaxID=1965302 RepID=UPI003F3A489B